MFVIVIIILSSDLFHLSYNLMWVDFRFVYFKGDTLFMIRILSIVRWDLGKIPTEHELNQVVK